jgi:hypothetical protein
MPHKPAPPQPSDPVRATDEDTHGAVDLTRPKDEVQERGDPHPHMPHERDERVGMTDGKPDPRMRKGQQDVQRGVQDTSRGSEADRTYEKLRKS